ncbi:hypothetical protein MFRU_030g00580 [Monilinia fructicola]|uniref:Uncharacterized protein n=1 Tax=Monilinia fructicola TaxID=38448 RepID=A0A5M9K1F0_MONFR|nr:hypothetical protein EYC84_003917 [Monilinia fructicola]KAG4027422.1 hypothetical protein MFRU_030g00580 [Monilinia fructicola]
MKFSPIVASALLFVLPAMVSAAPTSSPAELATANPLQLFTRDGQTCGAPKPVKTGDKTKDAAAQKKYDDLMKKMSDATKAAHAGQSACPSSSLTDFSKSKDKTKRTQLKTKCVNGYQACVTNRKAANSACQSLGGTVDQGHLTAVTVCQTSLNTWKAKTP